MHKAAFAVAASALLVVSMVGPGVAATNGDLDLSVTQDESTVTVTVIDNGTAASNATVTVSVLETLEEENETAEDTNETTEETNETTAGTNETVEETNETTDENTTTDWAIEGTYDAAANGTVTLDAPETTVRVEVTATVDNRTVNTTTVLEAATEEQPDVFGQRVQAFVQELLSSGTTGPGIGQSVSAFVTANNPGSEHRPDHAGPPDHAGANTTVTDGEDDQRGPPDHAGPGDDVETVETEEDEDESDE